MNINPNGRQVGKTKIVWRAPLAERDTEVLLIQDRNEFVIAFHNPKEPHPATKHGISPAFRTANQAKAVAMVRRLYDKAFTRAWGLR